MSNCDVENQVADVCGAIAADVQALQDAVAKLGYKHFPACRRACFFDEVAQLIACIVVLVIDVRTDLALSGVVTE
jgi:hypothetical protein